VCGGVTADAEANFSNLQRALSALQDRRLASSSQSLRASPFSIESDCPDTRASDHPPSLLMTTPSPPSAADWSADDLLDLMTAENDPDHRCASPGPPSRGVPVRHSVGPTEPLAQPPDAPLTCAEGHECSPVTSRRPKHRSLADFKPSASEISAGCRAGTRGRVEVLVLDQVDK